MLILANGMNVHSVKTVIRSISRRELIKTGALGIGLLAISNRCSSPLSETGQPWPKMKFLPENAQRILFGIYNGITDSFLPKDQEERRQLLFRMIASTDQYLYSQPKHIQNELLEAFDFLSLKPVRWFVIGIYGNWEDASPTDIVRFIDSWLVSHLMLFRSVATFLQSMTSMAFFDQPESWPIVGYRDPSWVFKVKWPQASEN